MSFLKNNFIGYATIGIVNSILGYSIIFASMYFFKLSPELSNFIGYGIGIFTAYILNRNFNFKSNVNFFKGYLKFLSSMIVSYLLNLLTVAVSFRIFKINPYLSQIFGGIVYFITGYSFSKFYVFKQK